MKQHEGRTDSVLTIGGADSDLYEGDLNFHQVADEFYWLVEGDDILINGESIGLCDYGCNFIADTGTSMLTGPSDDLYTLYDFINVDEECNGVHDLPTMTFVIDGVHYDLTGPDYTMAMDWAGNEIPYT